MMDVDRRTFLQSAGKAAVGVGLAGAVSLSGCVTLYPPGGAGGTGGGPGFVPDGGPAALSELSENDAGYTAGTVDELQAHGSARDGRIVWLPDGMQYDLTGTDLTLDGITVASARTNEGEGGAVLSTTDQGSTSHAWGGGSGTGTIRLLNGAQFMGVNVRGPHMNVQDHPALRGYFPFAPGSEGARERWRKARYARGITILGDNCVVGNCDIRGFGVQGICVGNSQNAPQNVKVRYSHVSQSAMTSLGYGIDVRHGGVTVYRCYLDACRHAMCGSGMADANYAVLESTFGPWTVSHPIDMHRVGNNGDGSGDPNAIDYRQRAGGTIIVRGCDIIPNRVPALDFINRNAGGSTPHASIRGLPKDGFFFENNRCSHASAADGLDQSGLPGSAQRDPETGFARMYYDGNEWGVPFEALNQIP